MFGFARTLVGLSLIAGMLWCSFRVKLGQRTFAEHVDRISETPEAREMLDATRREVAPMFEDATDRMLGEYIEAPTDATRGLPRRDAPDLPHHRENGFPRPSPSLPPQAERSPPLPPLGRAWIRSQAWGHSRRRGWSLRRRRG